MHMGGKSANATNYRGELLGALGYLLVMKAILPDERDANVCRS